jgi:hypothetical protein
VAGYADTEPIQRTSARYAPLPSAPSLTRRMRLPVTPPQWEERLGMGSTGPTGPAQEPGREYAGLPRRRHGIPPEREPTQPNPVQVPFPVVHMDPFTAQQIMKDIRTIRNVMIGLFLVAVFATVLFVAIGTGIASGISVLTIH